MSNHYQVLIIGGENAGLSVASKLLIKKSGLKIGIVDPSEKHYYQPAWTPVGAGIFDIKKTIRNEKDLIPKNTTWIKDAVSAFDPTTNTVKCISGTEITYDYLVVCPGIQLDWKKIEGLKETLGKNNVSSNYSFQYAPYTWEMIKDFKGGTAVFTNPSTPIKCGGAPHKIMYLACDYWRKKGILDKCDVHYISGASMIFGVKEYADTLQKVLTKYNIHTHYGANVTAINGETKMIEFETKELDDNLTQKLSSENGASYETVENNSTLDLKKLILKFDIAFLVHAQLAPDFIKTSPLRNDANPMGYVEVDKYTLQHSRFPNVFSLGYSSSAPANKTGAAIRKKAPVVVANLLAVMENKTPTARYEGYSACPIPKQYGKLMLAEFDYSNNQTMTLPINQANPNWAFWILKTKVLAWLDWNKILKGTA